MATDGIGEGPVGSRRLRLGMVGGGQGAYIGGIHRFAARLDGHYDLVAGAFDVDAARGHAFAAANHFDASRSYGDFRSMVAGEAARPDRVDVVAVCTPNHTHSPSPKPSWRPAST
jgi:predicted dehydrogenase